MKIRISKLVYPEGAEPGPRIGRAVIEGDGVEVSAPLTVEDAVQLIQDLGDLIEQP